MTEPTGAAFDVNGMNWTTICTCLINYDENITNSHNYHNLAYCVSKLKTQGQQGGTHNKSVPFRHAARGLTALPPLTFLPHVYMNVYVRKAGGGGGGGVLRELRRFLTSEDRGAFWICYTYSKPP